MRRDWRWLERVRVVFAALAMSTGCTATVPTPPLPPPCPACPSAPAPVALPPPPPTTTDPLLRRLLIELAALPAKEGWTLRELHVISNGNAAIAIIDQTERLADCNRGQPLILLGRSHVLSTDLTSGYRVLSAPNGAQLWNLRGNGPRFLVMQEQLCNFATSTNVYGLDENGEWFVAEGDARPSCVTCPRPKEDTNEGTPLFSRFAVSLTVAAGGPYFPTSADIYLIESWDGQRFRANLPAFTPLYEQRLAAARKAAKRARARGSVSCNVEVFSSAGEIYVYSRMLGKPENAALAEADQVVRGISTKACEKNHEGSMYGTQSFDWESMREQLVNETKDSF
jgi:hypothetical protein